MPPTLIPELIDVLRAKKAIAPYLSRTPLHYSAGLSGFLDAEVHLKHDEYLPLGAFKARGGFNLLANLTPEERARGLITASSGNHGQSIAHACAVFGARAIIVLPEGANPLKVAAMKALGAELVFHGENFDQAKDHCEALAREGGYRYVHPANEPLLIAGVATQTLEVMEDLPDVEYIFLPLGGGSSASGACVAAKAINPQVKVVAVQSEAAPGAYLSWKQGSLVTAPMRTFAEGTRYGDGLRASPEHPERASGRFRAGQRRSDPVRHRTINREGAHHGRGGRSDGNCRRVKTPEVHPGQESVDHHQRSEHYSAPTGRSGKSVPKLRGPVAGSPSLQKSFPHQDVWEK